MGDLSQFLPGFAVAVVVGLIAGPRLAGALGTGLALARAMVIALGAILAATLRPESGIPDPGGGPGICLAQRWLPPDLGQLSSLNEASLNVALFVPLGLAVGLLPASRAKGLAMAGAVVLPFAIEAVQFAVPVLGRYCDSADVADNLTGLAVGITAGAIARVATGHHNRAAGPSIGSSRRS